MYELAIAQETKILHEAFFAGKQLVCQRTVYWPNTNGDKPALMPSTALFCAYCGEIWGRRLYLEMPSRWRVDVRPCRKHGGGSLIDWDSIEGNHFLEAYYEDLFPQELYDYELEIHLART